jgi:uncharacterized membrane protein
MANKKSRITHGGKCLLFLVIVVLTQLIINLPKLTERGLWADELFTAGVIRYHPILTFSFERKVLTNIDLQDSFLTVKAGEQHPPLYDLILKVWAYCLNDSTFTLRLFSLLCLISSSAIFIGLAYKEQKKHHALYLSIALMLAALPVMQAYAIQARSYMFCVLLSSLILATVIRCRKRTEDFRILYILIAASFITHYYFALFTGALYLVAICYEMKYTRSIGRFSLVPILVVLVWGTLSYHSILFTAHGGAAWYKITLSESFASVVNSIYSYFGPFIYLGILTFLISVYQKKYTVLLGYLVLSISVLALALACSQAGIQHLRHFLFFVPWVLYLILAPLFSVVPQNFRLPAVIPLILVAYYAPIPQDVYPNEQYDKASRFIVDNWDANKTVYASWRANEVYYKYYLDDYSNGKIQLKMLSAESDVKLSCNSIAEENSPLFAHNSHKEVITEYLNCLPKGSEKVKKQFGNLVVVYSPGH